MRPVPGRGPGEPRRRDQGPRRDGRTAPSGATEVSRVVCGPRADAASSPSHTGDAVAEACPSQPHDLAVHGPRDGGAPDDGSPEASAPRSSARRGRPDRDKLWVPRGLRIATFEDMTVAQALSLPYPEWQCLSKRERAAALERQARSYSQAAVCCFTTQWAADSAINDYGVPAEKTHVVGVGRNHSPRPAARDWGAPRFLFVGGDWERKNGDAVVRSFARVRESIPEPASTSWAATPGSRWRGSLDTGGFPWLPTTIAGSSMDSSKRQPAS